MTNKLIKFFLTAAVLVAAAAMYSPEAYGIGSEGAIRTQSLIEMSLGVAIGAITFAGSLIAFAKLNGNMSGAPILLPGRHVLNLATLAAILGLITYFTQDQSPWVFFSAAGLAFAIGFLLIIPIGGADMPVVISMLNSYSGWAAAAMGFTLHNSAMIITGALVGSSGAILSYIMCRAMNRSFISVIAGGFGAVASAGGAEAIDRPYKRGSAEDAAFLLKQAEQVIIVPGYGMAVAQAQHVCRELHELIQKKGGDVKYAIHPVAGRMPGHLNVILSEAGIDYGALLTDVEDANRILLTADVAVIIGANDIVNPDAEEDKSSPLYGMPIFRPWTAKTVFVIKRGKGTGFSGVENPLFTRENTLMLYGDAKGVLGRSEAIEQ
jgi:NAD(P) transhydrogenase subunit beta